MFCFPSTVVTSCRKYLSTIIIRVSPRVCGTDSTSRPVGYPGSDDDSSGAGEGSIDCARAVTAIIGDRQLGRDFFFIFFFLLSPIFWLTLARRNFNDVAIFGYRRMSKPNEGSFFRKLVKCYCKIINLLYMGRGIRLEWGIFLCKFCC